MRFLLFLLCATAVVQAVEVEKAHKKHKHHKHKKNSTDSAKEVTAVQTKTTEFDSLITEAIDNSLTEISHKIEDDKKKASNFEKIYTKDFNLTQSVLTDEEVRKYIGDFDLLAEATTDAMMGDTFNLTKEVALDQKNNQTQHA